MTDQGKAVSVTKSADALESSLLEKAQNFDERRLAFELASQVRRSDMIREASAAIATSSWGKGLSEYARAAVARYSLEIGADPVRHIDVLGGSVYLNSRFYIDLVAANPKFLRAEVQYIHDDPRASETERQLRKELRIRWAAPDEAKGAAIVTLHYDGSRGPFQGCNWAGRGRKTDSGKFADPVGEAEPEKTAMTRAYRKAAMQAEPAWFREHPRMHAAEEVIAQGRVLDKIAGPETPSPPVVQEPPPDIQPLADAGVQGTTTQQAELELPRTGIIEEHEPAPECAIVGEHKREHCGHFTKKAGS